MENFDSSTDVPTVPSESEGAVGDPQSSSSSSASYNPSACVVTGSLFNATGVLASLVLFMVGYFNDIPHDFQEILKEHVVKCREICPQTPDPVANCTSWKANNCGSYLNAPSLEVAFFAMVSPCLVFTVISLPLLFFRGQNSLYNGMQVLMFLLLLAGGTCLLISTVSVKNHLRAYFQSLVDKKEKRWTEDTADYAVRDNLKRQCKLVSGTLCVLLSVLTFFICFEEEPSRSIPKPSNVVANIDNRINPDQPNVIIIRQGETNWWD